MSKKKRAKLIPHPLAAVADIVRRFEARAEGVFEEDSIKYLLNEYEASNVKWRLIKEHEQRTGNKQLTWYTFCDYFESFPLVIQTLTTKVSKSDRLHELFRKFDKFVITDKWFELRDELPQELRSRPFGLLVKWPFIPRGMLFHSLGDTGGPGLRLCWRHKKTELVGEPFPQFVRWLKQTWSL